MRVKLTIIFLIIVISVNAQINLSQGLVAYYPFNGNANDASGNGINGATNGVTLTTDSHNASNSAFEFNGLTDYISLPYNSLYNFSPNDSFSISCWIQPYGNPAWAIAQALVVKSPLNANYQASMWNYGLYIVNDKAMTGWAANNFLNAFTIMKRDKCWYHLVVTYKNGIWYLYVNGKVEAQDLSQTHFIIQDGNASSIAFGRKGEADGDYYKGKLDEVRIYNRNLNSAEVDSLFKQNYDKTCWEDPCKSWLKTPSYPSAVDVGKIDIIGDNLTIEALCNRKSQYDDSSVYNFEGDIVAKHDNFSNVNYLLRPNDGSITTVNGFFKTPSICDIDTLKTYHVAMVYDGSTLKFYRNGFMMSSINATGNLAQNNWTTRIGLYQSQYFKENFLGHINEVRIWNIARTQQQLQQYMNDTLPNPTALTGLKAYYTFNSLKNKQGNSAFDGTIIGAATINESNPQCNLIIDSCSIIPLPPSNPNCKGVIQLTKTSKVTPPTPIKKYFANTGFTWECWFNSSYYANTNTTINTRNKIISVLDAPQCQDIVLGFGWPQVAQQNELCFVADGPNGCKDRDNNPCKYFPSGGFVPNSWYHVAAVRDYANSTSKLYVNGVLVDSKTNSHGPINPTLIPFFGLGSYTGLIDSGFAGKLDEIRIWNYPRTATQVQSNYNKCLDGNETGLVAYYHSNEGKGTTLKDASPNANNATLSSSVTWDKTDNAPLVSTCYQSTFAATVNKTICNGQTYLGHNTSGVYNDTTTNSYGCDSISILNLTILPSPTTTKDTISGCGQVIINGNTYTSNTIVSTSIKNQLGCDSVLQQHQVLITSKKDTTIINLCSGQKFWNHTSTFDTTLKTIINCDSNLHIILTFTPFIIDSVTKTICKGDTLKGHFTAGIYRDTTRTGNCDTIHIINLIVRNITPSLQQDSSICEGDFVNLYPGNYKKYVWSNGSTSSSIKAKNIGLYWVEVTDSFGCKGKDSFVLMNVFSKPANFMPSNIQACVGELYTVNGYTNYNWITGETTPAINLNGLPAYWLQVSNSYGCVGSDTMKVVYLNNLSMQLATAFSPNGDGINDEFKPFSSSCILQYQLSIFNRWGQKVFQTQNPNKAWNGMLNNKPLPTDVYYYIITYKTITGVSQTKSGYITLLR